MKSWWHMSGYCRLLNLSIYCFTETSLLSDNLGLLKSLLINTLFVYELFLCKLRRADRKKRCYPFKFKAAGACIINFACLFESVLFLHYSLCLH